MLSIGLPVGTLVGAAGAGYLADAYSWRTVFLFLGVPGVLVAIIAWATLRDPPRGLSDGAALAPLEKAPSALAVFRHLKVRRSFWHIVAALALTYFAAAGIGSFVPQYFARVFDLAMGESGLMYGIIGFVLFFVVIQQLWQLAAAFGASMVAAAIMTSKRFSPGLAWKRWRKVSGRNSRATIETAADAIIM